MKFMILDINLEILIRVSTMSSDSNGIDVKKLVDALIDQSERTPKFAFDAVERLINKGRLRWGDRQDHVCLTNYGEADTLAGVWQARIVP